jgi:hypothetical protein
MDNEAGSDFNMINTKGGGNKEVRIVKNDPNYERINGLREAREARYVGKIWLTIGIVTLPLLGFGIVFLIMGLAKNYTAERLEAKYRE